MDITITGVDTVKGLSLCGGDEDRYFIVLRTFADDVPETLGKLRNITSENLPGYATAISGVKETSKAIGADELSQSALNLETLARAGDFAGVQAGNAAFLSHADSLVKEVKGWLNRNRV